MLFIHNTPGSFSERWFTAAAQWGLAVRQIDCLSNDLVNQCRPKDLVLWHVSHADPRHALVARQVVAALEFKGVTVYPNMRELACYDDKIAQKYLLEAAEAPLVPTYVFTSLEEALAWVARTTWPKVFKLRCGAGSSNVRLVHTKAEAEKRCFQAFSRGHPAASGGLQDLTSRLRGTRNCRQFWDKVRRAPVTLARAWHLRTHLPVQRGYVYFQDFLPHNTFDTRITVIGDRAFGFLRLNRPNDFRASGSGILVYDRDQIDPRCLEVAFTVARRLGTQSLAFDFLQAADGSPRIGEISYAFVPEAVYACPGHWNPAYVWQPGQVWPQDCILRDLMAKG